MTQMYPVILKQQNPLYLQGESKTDILFTIYYFFFNPVRRTKYAGF